MSGYSINLDYLCRNRNFSPEQVVSSDLVVPSGAVPNSMLLWIRIELSSGDRRFLTLPLVEFHKYVSLPESSIGGWTDGSRGSDSSGLDARYANYNSGGGEEIPDELQQRTKSVAAAVDE